MSVMTLHFKDEILSETGEPSGKVRNVEVIGAFVEGNALIMGLSPEITAFVPLDQLTWASIYEGEVTSGSSDEATVEGSADDSGSESADVAGDGGESSDGAAIFQPDFTGSGGNSADSSGSDG